MKQNIAKIILFGFAIVSVSFVLVHWKKQDRANALSELKKLKVQFNQFSDEVHINLTNPKVTDLTKLGELIVRAEQLEDGTPINATVLDLTGNANLRSLQGIENMPSLRSVIAIDCPKLADANGVTGLPILNELILTNNNSLQDVSAIRDLPSLVTLDLTKCEFLDEVTIDRLPLLENLYLSGCRDIESIDVSSRPKLKQLFLDGCINLKEINGLGNLVELTDLDISNCQTLKHLKGIDKLVSLIVLDVRNIDIPDYSLISHLPSLEVLRLAGQGNLTSLKPFQNLPKLNELHVEACRNFTSLAGMPPTIKQYAAFTKCENLVALQGVEAAPNLRHLELSDCTSLSDISAATKLPELVQIYLVNCRKVKDISLLKNSKKLRFVRLGGSGVTPAIIEELQDSFKECIFDFSE